MPTGPRPSPPTGVAKVTYLGTYGAFKWENVIWAAITGSLTYSNIATYATDMYGCFETNFLAYMHSDATLEECKVTYYDGAGNPEGSASASHSGALSGTAMPPSVAALVSWKIPASWRGGKPRTYLIGVGSGELDSTGTLADSYVAGLETAALAFMTACNGITLSGVTANRIGTVSFQHAKAWRTPPVMFEYVAVGVQKRLCTQRRRLGDELF